MHSQEFFVGHNSVGLKQIAQQVSKYLPKAHLRVFAPGFRSSPRLSLELDFSV
jgi:hypothetical protein